MVTHFGATPNDARDDTSAIQLVFSKAKPGSVIWFERGTYDVSKTLRIDGAKGIALVGAGTTFVVHAPVTLFDVANTSGVRIEGISVDYVPATSFLVRVGKTVSGTAVHLHARQPFSGPVEGVLGLDVTRRRPAGRDLYMIKHPAQVKALGKGTIELSGLRAGSLPAEGTHAVVRPKIYGAPVIRFAHCRDIDLKLLRIFSGSGMGMIFLSCESVELREVQVAPRPGNPALSTNADATHFNSCRGKILFEGCRFERMGDDAINVHGTYSRVMGSPASKSIRVVTGRRDVEWMPVPPCSGDRISIHLPDQPFGRPVFQGAVVATKPERSNLSAEITFSEDVPAGIPENAVVWNRSASPELTVRNCTFVDNRARGILVQSSNTVIEHNWFEGMSGSAINVTCDVGTWWESGPTENVTIRNNMIAQCNDGAGANAGAISVFADAPGIPPQSGVHRRLRIENNVIRQVRRAGISISASSDILISGNGIREVSGPGVLVKASTDVKVSNNRFEGVTENVAHE